VQRVTWLCWLCNGRGRGGSNDENNKHWEHHGNGRGSAVPPRVDNVRQVDANVEVNIGVLRRLHWDITVQQERAAEGATRAGRARRGSRQQSWRRADIITRASNEKRTA
jgi:hypothetical protein